MLDIIAGANTILKSKTWFSAKQSPNLHLLIVRLLRRNVSFKSIIVLAPRNEVLVYCYSHNFLLS